MFYEEYGLSDLNLEDAIAKTKHRPYAQFKEAAVAGLEPTKHELVKRKTKVRKYIKKIKIDELSEGPANQNPFKRIK